MLSMYFRGVGHQLIIKSEITDDAAKSQIKVEKIVKKSKETKRHTRKINRHLPTQDTLTAITKIPNLTVKRLPKTVKKPATFPKNKTIVMKMCVNTLKRLPKIIDDKPSVMTEKTKHYTNFEAVLAHSNATPIRSHDGFAYTCCFCTDQYTNPAELKKHTLMTHDNSDERRDFMKKQCTYDYLLKLDITELKCKICDQSIDTLELLFDHFQNEHKKKICRDIKNQIFPFKFDGEDHKCVMCLLVFSKFKVLLEHMHTHYRNFVCEVCDYGCNNMRRMYNHKQLHKTGSFECGKCNKVFETHQRMSTHMNAVHKYKNKPNKCGICNERFNSGPMKDKHMVTLHGMSPVIRKCSACDKTFTSQNLLRTHTKKFHLMERRFQCTECDMTFFAKTTLQYHMLKHTGKKDFQCDVCLKWFTRKYALTEHMRIHMNDRRFTCLQCGRGFVQKCSWRSHMRTVHGEIDDKQMST
ncbi:gastrula zinc finger protein XlCGF26.1-like [Maniola hyperantus]|uniref:gastrula zinc finger protein XlCGF26.1-like n=1 Tax=Aphantopus hyperantus TaxID=2795564 RepID=UPI0037478354